MASQRRGRGRTPEFRGTLGTLWRTTVAQAGVVREVLASGARAALERGAREGRSRLDEARAERRREETLAELGGAVLELIRAGEIDLEELPEVRELVAELDAIDDDAIEELPARSGLRGRGRARGDERDVMSRDEDDELDRFARFDRDDRPGRGDDGRVARSERPANRDDEHVGAMPPSRSRFDDRDAVAATPASPRRISPPTRIWRPASAAEPAPTRGGITFDDEDLADYMQPDDVPANGGDAPKDPPGES